MIRINLSRALILTIPALALVGCGQSETQVLTDVSGVWRDESDGAIITIDLSRETKMISSNGHIFPVIVESVDTTNHIMVLGVNRNDAHVTWVLRQIFLDDGSFTLLITLDNGIQDHLSFIRDL